MAVEKKIREARIPMLAKKEMSEEECKMGGGGRGRERTDKYRIEKKKVIALFFTIIQRTIQFQTALPLQTTSFFTTLNPSDEKKVRLFGRFRERVIHYSRALFDDIGFI